VGLGVTLDRPEPAFSHLERARPRGFMLTGTGRARVRTAKLYRPGARLRVTMRGPAGALRRDMTVGSSGRVRITVPLGDDAMPGTTRVSIR
jgi:hypothetical protein